jgi:hypothetical protein
VGLLRVEVLVVPRAHPAEDVRHRAGHQPAELLLGGLEWLEVGDGADLAPEDAFTVATLNAE